MDINVVKKQNAISIAGNIFQCVDSNPVITASYSGNNVSVLNNLTSRWVVKDAPYDTLKNEAGIAIGSSASQVVSVINSYAQSDNPDSLVKNTDTIRALDGVPQFTTAETGRILVVGDVKDGSIAVSNKTTDEFYTYGDDINVGDILATSISTFGGGISVGTGGSISSIGAITTNSYMRADSLYLEGSTDDLYETHLIAEDPTQDNVITLPNTSGTVALLSDISSGSLQNVVEDTTPQLGGDLDTNGHNLDLSGNTNSQLVITANQYAFRYKSPNGTLQTTGLYFNATTGQYEYLDGNGNCIFGVKAGSGELSIGDINGGTNFVLPTARGTDGQILKSDGSGNVDWANATNLDYVDFDIVSPPSLADGRLAYDADRETLVFKSEHGEIAIGEGYKPVYNNTGSTIAKGSAVKATGVSGEKFLIELFDASSGIDEELYFVGVTQAAINDQTAGIVVSEGYVKHLDTSSYSVGAILYASETAGALTSTKPTSPNLGIPVAMVTKVDGSNGHIYVRPETYAHLNELHDVLINSPAEDHILAYNSVQNYWYNNTLVGVGGVTSVNSVTPSTGNVTLDTDDISEGSTNEYYTDAKVDARIAAVVNETAMVTIASAGITLENSSYDNQFIVINSALDVDVEMEGYGVYYGWEVGTEFYFMQSGAGTITLVSLGPQFYYPSDKQPTSRTQYSVIGMKCIVAPTASTQGYWVIFGDLKDA